MLKARKANRVIRIPDEKKDAYAALGYKITDMNDKVVAEPHNAEKEAEINGFLTKFEAAMDDDFNAPAALGEIFSFDACEKRAEAVLHRISFDRVKRLPEIPDMVKDAICAMAEIDYQEEKKTPGVKSENSDGYAVTYADSGNTTGASGRVALMYQEASIYLGNTGLLYKGVSKKYDCEQ